MNTTVILTCILSSTVAAAIVTSIKEIVIWKLNRKAKIEDETNETSDHYEEMLDKLESKVDQSQKDFQRILEILETLEKKMGVSIHSNQILLKDRIKYIAITHIRNKEISFEDRELLHEMWEIYHFGLEGNGDLDLVMDQIDNLPLRVSEKVPVC